MKTRIRIRTPQGCASVTEAKLKPFLIGSRKIQNEVYVNDEDDTIIWEIEGKIRDIMSINRNVALFDSMMSQILKSKVVRGSMAKLSKEDEKQLKEMLTQQTTVEVLKEATLQELDEYNKPLIQRIKEKFKKKN